MKAQLIPLYFEPGRDADFDTQLQVLERLFEGRADLLEPLPLGAALPEADAVVFPQLLGDAYRRLPDFKAINFPILIITSEFGTLSMWDWEIIDYLKSEGVETIAPYNLEQAEKVCQALQVRRQLREARFVVYQDNPGAGAQASIFKRFYWWEDECTQRMKERFGVSIEKRSFRELGERARCIPDAEAARVVREKPVPVEGISETQLYNAYKLYLAVKEDLDQDGTIGAAGINCLNESHFSNTTPCLAWNLLYQDQKLVWGCEADTVSMLTKYVLHHSLNAPIMMTNLYPFLLGQAALKHERIEGFPNVEGDPANYILAAHCGFMGVIPQAFATDWKLRSKVLRIVDDQATAMDARLPIGNVTLAKLDATFSRLILAEGELTGYAQYPGSDCLNGGIIRVKDGHRLMNTLSSHHALLMTGHRLPEVRLLAKVFDLEIVEI